MRAPLISLAIVAVLAGAAGARAGEALLCHGGRSMSLSVRQSEGNSRLTLRFVASLRPALSALPAPGQCAFLQRAMAPSEPRTLVLDAPGVGVDFTVGANGLMTALAATGPHAARRPAERLIDAYLNGRVLRLEVEDTRLGWLRVMPAAR